MNLTITFPSHNKSTSPPHLYGLDCLPLAPLQSYLLPLPSQVSHVLKQAEHVSVSEPVYTCFSCAWNALLSDIQVDRIESQPLPNSQSPFIDLYFSPPDLFHMSSWMAEADWVLMTISPDLQQYLVQRSHSNIC